MKNDVMMYWNDVALYRNDEIVFGNDFKIKILSFSIALPHLKVH